MMRFKLFLVGMLFFMLSLSAEAKETVVKSSLESFSLRNPFESRLPQEEKKPSVKIKEIPKPIKIPIPEPVSVKAPVYRPPIRRPSPRIEKKQDKGFKKVSEPQLPNLEAKVTGLIWNSDRPQAIVNGEVLEIGDEINGMKIVNIQKLGIYVELSGKILKIKAKE